MHITDDIVCNKQCRKRSPPPLPKTVKESNYSVGKSFLFFGCRMFTTLRIFITVEIRNQRSHGRDTEGLLGPNLLRVVSCCYASSLSVWMETFTPVWSTIPTRALNTSAVGLLLSRCKRRVSFRYCDPLTGIALCLLPLLLIAFRRDETSVVQAGRAGASVVVL